MLQDALGIADMAVGAASTRKNVAGCDVAGCDGDRRQCWRPGVERIDVAGCDGNRRHCCERSIYAKMLQDASLQDAMGIVDKAGAQGSSDGAVATQAQICFHSRPLVHCIVRAVAVMTTGEVDQTAQISEMLKNRGVDVSWLLGDTADAGSAKAARPALEKFFDSSAPAPAIQGKQKGVQQSMWEQEFNKLSEGQMFDPRGSVGQKWAKQKSTMTDLADEYKKCVGRAAQQSFKLSWARKMVEKERQKREQQTWSMVDVTRGEYLSFGAIVLREGGWEDVHALRAAYKYVSKCAIMGSPWRLWNAMTEREDWLYMSKSWASSFEQSWTSFTTYVDAAEGDAPSGAVPSGGGGGSGGGDASVAEVGAKVVKAASVDGVSPRKPEASPTEKGKKQRPEVDYALADAGKWKVKYTQTMSSIAHLKDLIEMGAEWSWAKTEVTTQEINEREKSAQQVVTGSRFVKDLLSMDIAFLKSTYEPATILAEVRSLRGDDAVDRLQRLIRRLKQMHSAAQKSASPLKRPRRTT